MRIMSSRRSSVSLRALRRSPQSISRAKGPGVRSARLGLVLGVALAFLLSAAGSADARTVTYEVSRAGTTHASFDKFVRIVDSTLGDPRGWSLSGAVRFTRVSRSGQFTVRLTAPRVVGSYGGCSAYYSCRVGRYVMINDDRWRFGTRSYSGQPLHHYRQMVVNHEVGHALGFGHGSCRGAGLRASVMQQQSKSLDGCLHNPWPLWGERNALAKRLGVTVGPTPPGIEVFERIGSVEIGLVREKVLARLGDPARESPSGESSILDYPADGLTVRMLDRRVAAVSTSSDVYSTPGGVKVGSTSGDVKTRWSDRGVTCNATECVIEEGGARTICHLEDGRVTKIRIEGGGSTATSSAAKPREPERKGQLDPRGSSAGYDPVEPLPGAQSADAVVVE